MRVLALGRTLLIQKVVIETSNWFHSTNLMFLIHLFRYFIISCN